jgi:hypothetical protein
MNGSLKYGTGFGDKNYNKCQKYLLNMDFHMMEKML